MGRTTGRAADSNGGTGARVPDGGLPILPGALPPEMFTGPGFLAIGDLLPLMAAYFDPDERMRYLNKPMAEWLERSRSEVLGLSMEDVIGRAAYAQRKPMIERALRGERQFFVADFDHHSRGLLTVQTDYVPWVDSSGAVQGLIVIAQDVTEQRATERALRESEARFRRIANSAPVLMWVTRLDRSRDFVNDAYAAFLGMDRSDAQAFDWRHIIHPDDADRLLAESLAGEASLKPFSLEARYRRHDGEYRWMRSVSQPRFGADGDLTGFIGVATDITVAKQSQDDLKRLVEERTAKLGESEMQFRAIFDTVLEVLVLMKADGTVVQLNRKTASWRDPDPDKALGRKIWDSPTLKAYPQHIPLLKKAVAAAARGQAFNQEIRMDRDGAPTSYLDVFVQPIRNGSGDIVFLLFEARDITDLKAAQEQLRQSQKMEALGQLTGGIAHDFNNLLTVVVGGLDLLNKRIDEPKLRNYAQNALAAAERGARLTGQLLAFSRVQRLEVRPTTIAPLIGNMRPLLRNVLGPGIEKKFELEQQPLPVMADPTQVEVAVLNLAINARDAMPDGGTLTFTTRRVEISAHPEVDDGSYVELAIADTGQGMSDEIARRAFEPFFTTKEVGKGTGLGLSMVYGMARQSGGTATIHSSPGAGTTVRMLFRVADAAAEAAEGEAAPRGTPEHRQVPASILVIDDDPDVRSFIAETLEEQGYRVRQAADGQQGLAEIAAERPELVVLDFIMPGISGAEVASRILEDQADQAILFVSGYSETEAIRRAAPNALLLTKPFRAEALGEAVRKSLTAR